MPTEIIGEIGINHNGDMGIAKKLIDVAYSAGLNFVKFQKRNVDLVYTKEELASYRESPWGTTQREQKEGLEFSVKQYWEIDKYCESKGIGWFASPWDLESLHMLFSFNGCKFIKIASPLLTDKTMLKCCKSSDKQVILSTGMSTIEMINDAVEILGRDKIYAIFHCTSTYPCKLEEMNLRCIQTLKYLYHWTKVGFSNHHSGVALIPAAIALGAEIIETHITLDRSSYGSDQAASIEPEGVYKLVKSVRATEKALGDGVKKIYDSEIPIMKKLRK